MRTRVLPHRWLTVLGLLVLSYCAWAQGLVDPELEQAKEPWKLQNAAVIKDVKHQGEQAVKLQSLSFWQPATLEQTTPPLPAGVYELTLWARGEGRLDLTIRGVGLRRFVLAGDVWQQYSLVFSLPEPYACPVVISSSRGAVVVDDLTLQPGDEALRAAWDKQQKAFEQLGYIPSNLSAQRPAPGNAPTTISSRTPVPITEKIVLTDPRYDSGWSPDQAMLADWFAARGFVKKNARETLTWIEEKIKTKSAYGSVVTSCSIMPEPLLSPADETCPIRRYLDAGGRAIWLSHLATSWNQEKAGNEPEIDPRAYVRDVWDMEWDGAAFSNGQAELSAEGKRWGLTSPLPPIRAQWATDVTLVFAGEPAKQNASLWLKTFNPEYPLSGLIVYWGGISSASVATLGDVYRLALYTGKPVQVPPDRPKVLPPMQAELITRAAGAGRRAVVRGEVVGIQAYLTPGAETKGPGKVSVALTGEAPSLRVYQTARAGTNPESEEELAKYHRRGDRSRLYEKEMTVHFEAGRPVTVEVGELPTGDLGVGDYELALQVTHPALKEQLVVNEPLNVCPAPRLDRVRHTIRGYISRISFRAWTYMDWLKALGLGPEYNIDPSSGPLYDALLRNGQVWIGTHNTVIGTGQLDPAGQPAKDPWGGSVAGADTRDGAYRDCLSLGPDRQVLPQLRQGRGHQRRLVQRGAWAGTTASRTWPSSRRRPACRRRSRRR